MIRFGLIGFLLFLLVVSESRAQAPGTPDSSATDLVALRERIADGRASWHDYCALGGALARSATSEQSSWRARAEADDALRAGLAIHLDPSCLYELAKLREKQGSRIEAGRLLDRAEAVLHEQDGAIDERLLAEFQYRRALWLDDWIRNFEYLINVTDLAVSTPSCIVSGYFCENFRRPSQFNERLEAAPALRGVVADDIREVTRLLDSALALDARHDDARRLRLRRALVADDWVTFESLAYEGARIDSANALFQTALIAALLRRGDVEQADAVFVRLARLIGEQEIASFERVTLVSPGVTADNVEGLWRLSDPMVLTAQNERRLSHYARIALADIAFSDPATSVLGRDTQPGALVIRYGWPRFIWEVPRDMRRELDPNQMAVVFRIIGCPTPLCAIGMELQAQRGSAESYGRWTFFNYGHDVPNFIFERNLSSRTYRYKTVTQTAQFDSALVRKLPSSYESPFSGAALRSLVTRFPRPARPVLEVSAAFSWAPQRPSGDSIELGVFVHERVNGLLVNRGKSIDRATDGVVTSTARLPVIFGPLQVTVEGLIVGSLIGAQQRHSVMANRPTGELSLSDLLLGRGAEAPEVFSRRSEIRFVPRADSVVLGGDTLSVYWEIYGLARGDDSTVHYDVDLELAEVAGGRSPGAEFARVIGRLVGVEQEGDSFHWSRRRIGTGSYVPELISLHLPPTLGHMAIRVQVRDRQTGSVARTERVISVEPRSGEGPPH